MEVTICGPNLSHEAQRKGDMHVHAAGCADLKHYGRGRFGGEAPWTIEVGSRVELCDEVFPPEDFDCESGDNLAEFFFAPCVAELPEKAV